MGKRIKLLGVRELLTDEVIQPQRDYGIIMTASRISEETEDDDPEAITYKMKVLQIDSIMDLREQKPVEFGKGKTKSQKLRFMADGKLGKEDYEAFMDYLMSRFDELSEDYLDTLNNK